MNALPPWFHRLPDILKQLELLPADAYLDRTACEVLFDLRQTAAGNLLRRLGAQRVGKSLAISRAELVKRLLRLQADPSTEAAAAGARRAAAIIAEGRRTAAARGFQVTLPDPELTVEQLPGVTIEEGARVALRIEGADRPDLVQKIGAVVKLLTVDLERFLVGNPNVPPVPVVRFERITELRCFSRNQLAFADDERRRRSEATALLTLRKCPQGLYLPPKHCSLSELVRVLWTRRIGL